jgi:RHS repeat-associated protein
MPGDTTTSIASAIKNAFNADTNLQALGLSSTSSGANITTTATATTYTQSATDGGATVTLGFDNNGNTTATIGGKPASGNTVTVTVHSPLLSGGQEAVPYTLVSGDTAATTAAALAAAINADTHLQAIQVSAISTASGALAYSESFSASPVMTAGLNSPVVSATDGASNTKSNTYQVRATTGSSTSLTFDANGNMTNDGTNSYLWDAENRLVQINYPGSGNNSQFVYDANSGLVKITERASGTITSTKQFVRCGSSMCEERNASSAVTKQFFAWGQTISGTNYFYTRDHLGSVRDVTDSTGTVQAHYEYGMYGEVTQTISTQSADFGYAGMYYHAPSGLNLATYRAYSPSLGRWINRDPIGESGGRNLYAYVGNMPSLRTDPKGLQGPGVIDMPLPRTINPGSDLSPSPYSGEPNPIIFPDIWTPQPPNYNHPEYIGPYKGHNECTQAAFDRYRDCLKHPCKYPNPKSLNNSAGSGANRWNMPDEDRKCWDLYLEWMDDCHSWNSWMHGWAYS